MTCQDCLERLHDRLDGVPSPDAGVEAHLAACPDCRALFAVAGRLEAGLRLLAPPYPPLDLRDRVARRVLAEGVAVEPARPRWRRRLVGLAVAAGLLLALAVAARRPRTGEIARAPVPEPLPPPSLSASVAEATSAVAALTRRTADETVEGGRLLLPSVPMPEPDTALAQALEPPADSLREAGQGVSSGLEPVTNSARRAVALFLRDLTPAGDDRKPGL